MKTPAHKLAWRFVTGAAMDGRYRTDASWLHRSTLTHWPHRVVRWHHMPRLYRAAVRDGAVAAVLVTLWGIHAAPVATGAAWGVLAVAVAGWALWWAYRKLRHARHHWRYVRPLRRALTPMLEGAPPKLAIEPDRSETKIWLPQGFIGSDREWEMIERAIHVKLGIEAPVRSPQLQGAKPYVIFTRSDPPPRLVTWANVERPAAAAAPDELVVGIGKGGQVVKVSLNSDSPHFGISMGTGAGKSNLASFWLLQELRRGAIALILDMKLFSHPWAFKDMQAEYDQLPNVGYARRTSTIHDAMVWLGDELHRRNEVAERGIDAKGDMHGSVGPRLWIVAEELNMAIDLLKEHWGDPAVRQEWSDAHQGKDPPKKSPALTGMARVSYAGRAVDMHLIVIAQELTVASLGGGSVRANIGVRCLARYQESTWKMLVGRDVPMPPSPEVDGRVQCIAGPAVNEAQTPLMDKEQVRELAAAGVVTPCPAGMPGIAVPARTPIYVGAPDVGISQGHVPELPAPVTLSEAIRENILPAGGDYRRAIERWRKASHRPGFPDPLPDSPKNARVWNRSDLYAYVAGRNGHQ